MKTIEKRVGLLEDDLDDLDDYVLDWTEGADTYLRALRWVVEEKLGVSLKSYLETVEERGELEGTQ
ncbi:hypothetical protein ACFPYI_04320 [Halomarina salina]|uniref:Uncharacterized protein n=1 Tax=Halomarina salina TaxID=1872699 RepID=A0ABD5RK34_9EURY|nr:hypothetical protein [Halomarina salina]